MNPKKSTKAGEHPGPHKSPGVGTKPSPASHSGRAATSASALLAPLGKFYGKRAE
jgi:hypothetical protein